MTALFGLAERCEKVGGPDRELDCAIFDTREDRSEAPRGFVPRYTASLDAALTLVPEGHSWWVSDGRAAVFKPLPARTLSADEQGKAATPALALCAAALRARSV